MFPPTSDPDSLHEMHLAACHVTATCKIDLLDIEGVHTSRVLRDRTTPVWCLVQAVLHPLLPLSGTAPGHALNAQREKTK